MAAPVVERHQQWRDIVPLVRPVRLQVFTHARHKTTGQRERTGSMSRPLRSGAMGVLASVNVYHPSYEPLSGKPRKPGALRLEWTMCWRTHIPSLRTIRGLPVPATLNEMSRPRLGFDCVKLHFASSLPFLGVK